MRTRETLRILSCAAVLSAGLHGARAAAADRSVDMGNGQVVKIAADRPLKVAIFSEGANNSAMQASIDGAKQAAAELGWQIDVFDGKFDTVTQVNQLQSALTRGYDAWVLKAVEGNAACDIATRQAPAANVAVVTSVLPICGRASNESAALWAPGTLAYIGGSETPQAFFRVLDRMARENPGPQKLGVITGPELNPITKNHEAALKMLRGKYPSIVVTALARTDYSTPVAMEKAESMVQANPDITLYYVAFSNLAKGLVPVLEQAGRLDKVKVYDNGATAWALAALKSGKIALTSANRLRSNAYNAVYAIDKARRGEPVAHVLGDLGAPLVEGRPPAEPFLIDAGNVGGFTPEIK